MPTQAAQHKDELDAVNASLKTRNVELADARWSCQLRQDERDEALNQASKAQTEVKEWRRVSSCWKAANCWKPRGGLQAAQDDLATAKNDAILQQQRVSQRAAPFPPLPCSHRHNTQTRSCFAMNAFPCVLGGRREAGGVRASSRFFLWAWECEVETRGDGVTARQPRQPSLPGNSPINALLLMVLHSVSVPGKE